MASGGGRWGLQFVPRMFLRKRKPPESWESGSEWCKGWIMVTEDVLTRSPSKEGRISLTAMRMTVAAFSCQSQHRLFFYRKTLYPSSDPPRGHRHSVSDGDGVSMGPFSTEFPWRSVGPVRLASWPVPPLLIPVSSASQYTGCTLNSAPVCFLENKMGQFPVLLEWEKINLI